MLKRMFLVTVLFFLVGPVFAQNATMEDAIGEAPSMGHKVSVPSSIEMRVSSLPDDEKEFVVNQIEDFEAMKASLLSSSADWPAIISKYLVALNGFFDSPDGNEDWELSVKADDILFEYVFSQVKVLQETLRGKGVAVEGFSFSMGDSLLLSLDCKFQE